MDRSETGFNSPVWIISRTEDGERFRPSNWVERVAEVLGSFPRDKKLEYSPFLRPVFHNELGRCLFVDFPALEAIAPGIHDYVAWFMRSNRLTSIACVDGRHGTAASTPGPASAAQDALAS
ncbi:DUF3579 domain-containing protein [Acidihalobacter ferrooxydans]|uniref:DUF3579 domain-containing protein n=1 Tax=Acidihalobacter ferrooxydans TaxID=1765967 RepID=A0A1P8UJV1_9GAMM|nr:DUF3579 domain-containing protein [Acidihalobacter ferrooxydans]APZ44109.1 hypothetical protein BW247_14230 [Acidihalobacter ferrooxydans]